MKVKILAALKTKFEGVQDAILGRVADKLVSSGKVTKEEDIATAVAGVTFQQILESYGDSRADEASTTAVRNYEKKHNLKDGKAVEDTGNQTQPSAQPPKEPAANANQGGSGENKTPDWVQTLLDQNKALNERLNAMEKGRTTASRRTQLDSVIAKLPDNLRKAYSRTPVEAQSDEEFTSLLADITNEVAEIERTSRAAGAALGRPLGAGSRAASTTTPGGSSNAVEATDAEVDAVVAKLNI